VTVVGCAEFNGREQINRVVSHPTLPLTITAHEDHHLRFFDNNTGIVIVVIVIILFFIPLVV